MEENKRDKTHGTTILALKYDKGVIIAADRRCTSGSTIFSDEEIKIEDLGSMSAIAMAGWVSDIQYLIDILKDKLIPWLEKFWDIEIYVDGQAKLLKHLIRNNLFMAWPILAGWDPCVNAARIFLIEPGGAIFEPQNYTATGSGGDEALRLLKSKWSKNCSEKKGIEIAIEALLAASESNIQTSNPLIHPPTIKAISSEGITDISGELSLKIAWEESFKKQEREGKNEKLQKYIESRLELKNPNAKKRRSAGKTRLRARQGGKK